MIKIALGQKEHEKSFVPPWSQSTFEHLLLIVWHGAIGGRFAIRFERREMWQHVACSTYILRTLGIIFHACPNASSDFRWKFRTEKSKLREFRNPGIQYFIHVYQLYYFYEKPINVEWNISFKLYLKLLCFTIFIVVLKNLECKHKLVIFVAFLRNFGIRERSGQILNKWRLNAFRSAPMVVITPTILTRSKKMKEAAWAAWFLR